ncbi:cytochrome c oxidase subunit 2 [Limoniibacter endophyticus]|uniref:Cytochrome c oxidase subunit 2 n=2 Tax=Limoniibacter endophyticus TaxID=1565040 RepID=A0A8J3DPP1_9HYPH|nr:cytochrome c oxidase subunit 2 [Limoniibacter endophyticus]
MNSLAGRPSRLCTAIALALLAGTGGALADQPTPWQARFQEAATGIMHEITWFEHYTLWFIIPITLLVLALLGWCMFRYSEKRNPIPSRTSHNTTIEVIWTVGPVLILLALAVPSFALLTSQYTPPEEPALTIKATANQWNWDYEYQVGETFSFNSALLPDNARADAGKEDRGRYPRLLAVDNEVVVPVNTTVRLLVTASDVIHAFALPAFGLKTDAVPGRINETWFKAQKEGMYYGQCSELCGQDHAYMPIAIHVVPQADYEQWVARAATDVPGANRALQAKIDSETNVADAGN